MSNTIIQGDALQILRTLPDESVQCCVSSPPYWGLRDYGVEGQMGLEPTLAEYVSRMVEVFREVHRVLQADGTCWINLGDSYARDGGRHTDFGGRRNNLPKPPPPKACGLRPKQLIGIPWRVAFALQADGWYLRSDVVWHKPDPLPEAIQDRPTRCHEFLFLLARSERYYYDDCGYREPVSGTAHRRGNGSNPKNANPGSGIRANTSFSASVTELVGDRRARDVWMIPTASYSGPHYAVMPDELARRCVLLGSRVGDVVLDPFCGTGTTCLAAHRLDRRWIGIELSPSSAELARCRLSPALAQQRMAL